METETSLGIPTLAYGTLNAKGFETLRPFLGNASRLSYLPVCRWGDKTTDPIMPTFLSPTKGHDVINAPIRGRMDLRKPPRMGSSSRKRGWLETPTCGIVGPCEAEET
jgi:hypothetical protein